jgi:hypothetical protein
MKESYKWPPECVLTFSSRRGIVYFRTTDRKLDLADSLMLNHPYTSRLVCMSVSTESAKWDKWTEDKLQKIEDLIRYDITFDGYRVTIKRMTRMPRPQPFWCTKPFQWLLQIR